MPDPRPTAVAPSVDTPHWPRCRRRGRGRRSGSHAIGGRFDRLANQACESCTTPDRTELGRTPYRQSFRRARTLRSPMGPASGSGRRPPPGGGSRTGTRARRDPPPAHARRAVTGHSAGGRPGTPAGGPTRRPEPSGPRARRTSPARMNRAWRPACPHVSRPWGSALDGAERTTSQWPRLLGVNVA
jgi:hypothetical protein